MDASSQPGESTLHPDGWVGDPAELERARRYRKAIYWGFAPIWVAAVAIWFVDPPIDLILFGVILADVAMVLLFQSRISRAIGRKWTLRLEGKEKRHGRHERVGSIRLRGF